MWMKSDENTQTLSTTSCNLVLKKHYMLHTKSVTSVQDNDIHLSWTFLIYSQVNKDRLQFITAAFTHWHLCSAWLQCVTGLMPSDKSMSVEWETNIHQWPSACFPHLRPCVLVCTCSSLLKFYHSASMLNWFSRIWTFPSRGRAVWKHSKNYVKVVFLDEL